MQERYEGAATLADALADTSSERGSVSAGCGGQHTLIFVQMWMVDCALAAEGGVAKKQAMIRFAAYTVHG